MFYGKTQNIKQAKKDLGSLTQLRFEGTVKVHGTNAGIHINSGIPTFVSRSRKLTLQNDNAGFMSTVLPLLSDVSEIDGISIFGEWCGGNIQKGVAISGGPKYFVIFKVMVHGIEVDISRGMRLFKSSPMIANIKDFDTFVLFGTLAELEDQMFAHALQVEECCPVGTILNPGSKCNIGEGIVWQVGDYRFKTKGEKHKRVGTKEQRIPSLKLPPEIKDKANQAVAQWCNVDRLEQGKEVLAEQGYDNTDVRNIGVYLRWVMEDILAEETDVPEILALDELVTWNRLSKEITSIAKEYYL
jgi:hypothetical protein